MDGPDRHRFESFSILPAGAALLPRSAPMDKVDEVRVDHGLEGEGIVINRFQARVGPTQQVVTGLGEEGLPVPDSFLSSSVKIKESLRQAKPMIHLDRGHKPTLEFGALFDEPEAACKARAKAAAEKRSRSSNRPAKSGLRVLQLRLQGIHIFVYP